MATNESVKAAREIERAEARAAKEKARILKQEQSEFAKKAAEAEKMAAKAEVEAFELELRSLVGAHLVTPEVFNWAAQHYSLPPHPPAFHAKHHLREAVETILLTREYERLEERLAVAWSKDEKAYYENYAQYEKIYERWVRLKSLAIQLHAGDTKALNEAHAELLAQGLIPSDAAGIVLQPFDARRSYISFRVEGRYIIPREVKSITQAGKVSSKNMPKNRALELYEDHVCSRILAVARHLFASLPMDEVIITAYAPTISTTSGNETDIPVVSVHFHKEMLVALDFDNIDPSDALQSFRYVGDVRASKRGEEFTPIRSLAFDALSRWESRENDIQSLSESIERIRMSFRKFQTRGYRTAVAAATEQE